MANLNQFMIDMEAAVTKAEGETASVETLLAEFTKYVALNKNDPVALQAFVDRTNANSGKITAAVAANPDPDTTD